MIEQTSEIKQAASIIKDSVTYISNLQLDSRQTLNQLEQQLSIIESNAAAMRRALKPIKANVFSLKGSITCL